MKILITGASGFIGFHLSKYLLKNKKNTIIGIDNLNSYFFKKIKKKRLNILKSKKNFIFYRINLANEKKLNGIFNENKPVIIFHIAGQPGVIYSFKNPKIYEINNILVTQILSRVAKKYKVKKFIFASSSSVYGDQKKFPIKETFKLKPKNPYAITKVKSEKTIKNYFLNTKIDFIIFRFFTVYGPLGRHDMFIHKFLNALKKNKKIKLHNNGMNFRDFTYVDDVIKILNKSINYKVKNSIINICRSKPILTTKLVKLILKFYKKNNIKIIKTKSIKGEMLKTHGCNKKLIKHFGNIKFTDIAKGLRETIRQYKLIGF